MLELNATIGAMKPSELKSFIEKQIEDRSVGQIPGLTDIIAAAAPSGTIRLAYAAGGSDPGWINCDGASVSKATYAQLDKVVAAAGYPDGQTASEFTVIDLTGLEPDPTLVYRVKT